MTSPKTADAEPIRTNLRVGDKHCPKCGFVMLPQGYCGVCAHEKRVWTYINRSLGQYRRQGRVRELWEIT